MKTVTDFAISGLDIISTTITTIKGASSMVVAIITPTITFPLGEFARLSSCDSKGRIKTFTFLAIRGFYVISTAIASVPFTSRIVVAIVTPTISLPYWCFTFAYFAFTDYAVSGLDIITTAISTIKSTFSIVVAIITPSISFPLRELASS